jgi:hypothetical protein
MTDRSARRERFLRQDLPTQLGSLASNLSLLARLAEDEGHLATVRRLVDDSAAFCEWSAPLAHVDTQVVLLDVQRLLALWRFDWERITQDATARVEVASNTRRAADRVLAASGLLEPR